MSRELINQLLGIDGQPIQINPMIFAEESTDPSDNDDDIADDNDNPPSPPSPPTPPSPDNKDNNSEEKDPSKAHIYMYMGSVVLILGNSYITQVCYTCACSVA